MKKNQLKKIVMAGLVAGTVLASQGVVNATEGECVMAAGAGCGGGSCKGQRPLTADNAAAQKPGYERPASQEEIEAYKKANPNHEQELERLNQNNANQPSQGGSCKSSSGCKGNTSSTQQPGKSAGCASQKR